MIYGNVVVKRYSLKQTVLEQLDIYMEKKNLDLNFTPLTKKQTTTTTKTQMDYTQNIKYKYKISGR